MKPTVSASLAAATVLLTSPALWAHHSFAMFDATRALTLHGEIKEFRWTNPHVFIQMLVRGEDSSHTEEWSIEMASPEHLARDGWKPRLLKGGDKVTIVVHPLREGVRGGQFVSGITSDGQSLGARPSREHGAEGADK